MNNRSEYCGQQNNRTARNILPDQGARMDHGGVTERERDAMPLHCGRPILEAKDSGASGANTEVEKLAGHSRAAAGNFSGSGIGAGEAAAGLAQISEEVRASVAWRAGEYDARRLRSQREIIRDVMLSAADCATWLTLEELRAVTRYGEASISAQLRHLRKTENGGYDVSKRHREGARRGGRPSTDGRGECVWEYRITREISGQAPGGTNSVGLDAVA